MTATDELRRLLDERGVEHYDGTKSTLWGYDSYNEVTGIYRYSADETSEGYMHVRLWHATPEQAVEATLGRGTCHVAAFGSCSECGARLDGIYQRYCPNCGAKVIEP